MVTGGVAPKLLPLGLQHVVQRPITLQDEAQRGRRPTQHQHRRHHPNQLHQPYQGKNSSSHPQQTPPGGKQTADTYLYRQDRLQQGEDHSPEDSTTNPADPNEPGAPQTWYLPEHLGPTTPCCPTRHTRRTLQNLNQVMPQRSASSTVQHLQYGTVVDCTVSKVSIDLPTSTTSACGNVALKAGSMENKVFLIEKG